MRNLISARIICQNLTSILRYRSVFSVAILIVTTCFIVQLIQYSTVLLISLIDTII